MKSAARRIRRSSCWRVAGLTQSIAPPSGAAPVLRARRREPERSAAPARRGRAGRPSEPGRSPAGSGRPARGAAQVVGEGELGGPAGEPRRAFVLAPRHRRRRTSSSSRPARRRPGRRPPASGCAVADRAGSSRSLAAIEHEPAVLVGRRTWRLRQARRAAPCSTARNTSVGVGTSVAGARASADAAQPWSWARQNAYTSFRANFCAD